VTRLAGGTTREGPSLVEGPNHLRSALPPGSYRLVVRPQRRESDLLPFEIVAGELTELRVELGD
jgi:hypothetical protein